MGNTQQAAQLFKNVASTLPVDIVKKTVHDLTIPMKKNPANISGNPRKVPILTDDEDVLKYMQEFGLYDPRRLSEFIVESYFSQFDSVLDGINDLKEENLDTTISQVKTAKMHYDIAIRNASRRDTELNEAFFILLGSLSDLQRKTMSYIKQIRKIDDRPKLSFFLHASLDIKKVKCCNNCAKMAINTILDIYPMLFTIGPTLKIENMQTITSDQIKFQKDILNGDNCSLMHAYDEDKESEFWLTLADRFNISFDNADIISDFMLTTSEDENRNVIDEEDIENISFI